MKRVRKYIFQLFLIGLLPLNSCETTELDLSDNPNELELSQSSTDFFLNSVQVDFATFTHLMGANGARLVRIESMLGRSYQNVSEFSPAFLETEWNTAYQADGGEELPTGLKINGILSNIRAMKSEAEALELYHHIAMTQVIEASTMVTLVDYFGDVPYSEALQANAETPILNPKVDEGAAIYAAALELLDKAIANFKKEVVLEPENDFYYNGNWGNWIKAANTLKMKIYLQKRLVDGAALLKFNTIVSSGNYIKENDEDFAFNWGVNDVQPDSRHPFYASNYLNTGSGAYMSNWFMNLMNSSQDPRVRYYFYRQTNAVPGQEISPNEEALSCSLDPVPQHYIDGGFTFCNLPNGYWGRDHGQDAGVPPDGFLKTTYGVYPAGGKFDDNSFEGVLPGDGGAGAGITPILLASWVDFMQAEIAMVNGDGNGAKAFMLSGIDKSMQKVMSFGELDPSASTSFIPTLPDVVNFEENIKSNFENATTETEKWNVLAEQYWVTLFGNGTDAYNFYRRTGYPTTLQPNLEKDPGGFILSLYYPSNFVNNNSSTSQKADVRTRVFWDNHKDVNFPIAN